MRVMSSFDITKARLAHLDWVFRTNRILDQGLSPVQDFSSSHRGCELGVWLHGEARRKYGRSDQIRQLAMEHRRFHQAVDEMLQALQRGDIDKTREMLINVSHMSKDIIYLLTLLELKSLERQRQGQGVLGVLSFIEDFFAPNTNWLEPPKKRGSNPAVELTYARLEHLRWSSKIDHSFRNFGQGAKLRTHNQCEFGIWIQGEGLQRYGGMPEIHILEGVHKSFHGAANQVIKSLQERRYRQADEAYVDIQNLSREIAWLLTVIEYRLVYPVTSTTPCAVAREEGEEEVSSDGSAVVISPINHAPVAGRSAFHAVESRQ